MDTTQLADHLRGATQRLVRQMNITATPGGMPALHRDVLGLLDLVDGLTSAELARRTKVTPQAVNQAVTRLLQQGLVSRTQDEADRRRQRLSLTPAGLAAIREVRSTKNSWLVTRLAGLTPAERATLASAAALLDQISDES